MQVQARDYRGEEDFLRIRDFLIETYGLTGRLHNWGIERWEYARYFVAPLMDDSGWPQPIRIWETAAGQIAGVVHPEDPGTTFLQIHPAHRDLEADMVGWAQDAMAAPDDQGVRKLSLPVYGYDTERQALLRERGYRRTAGYAYERRRLLEGPLPPVTAPEGYTIRALTPEDDLSLRCRVMGRAFGSNPCSVDVYKSLQSAPGYDRQRDVVAVAPDGTFAAFALTWFDSVNRIGMFEPVGTDPDHQQRGLGSAVMVAGLRTLQALGATVAYVGTGNAVPANRLYQATGFVEMDIEHFWEKTL